MRVLDKRNLNFFGLAGWLGCIYLGLSVSQSLLRMERREGVSDSYSIVRNIHTMWQKYAPTNLPK